MAKPQFEAKLKFEPRRLCTNSLGLFVASVLFISSCNVFAQDNASSVSAETTNTLFSDVEKKMVIGESVEGHFRQSKFISVLPKPLLSKGVFSYDKESGLDWLTQTPIVSRLVFNDQGIRQDVEGNTVWEIDGMQPAVLSITRVMTGVLSGNWPVLNEYFNISGKTESANWQLTMTPKDEVIAQLISSLKVSGKKTLKNLTLFEANGDRTEITFAVTP